jgi:hypothetical protein
MDWRGGNMGTEVHKRIAMEIKTIFERELGCFDFLDYLEVAKVMVVKVGDVG